MVTYIIYIDDLRIGKIVSDSKHSLSSVFRDRVKNWLKEEGQFICHDGSNESFFEKVNKIIRNEASFKFDSVYHNLYVVQY